VALLERGAVVVCGARVAVVPAVVVEGGAARVVYK
jgi:hypothetical protein